MEIGTIRPIKIEDEMRDSYLEYAMSVIVARALPDVRDGLKPVHRRILYSMHDLGLTSAAKYRKSATVVGDVLGKYHPHGDTAVYDTLVRLAQDFNMRHPLVDGQGNFGSVDGDRAAAMRYTECRMAAITDELLADIEKNTVDFYDNFDGTRQQPTVLPARFPNLLINGSAGIAVGMATNIPPHNLGEVSAALKHLVTVWGGVIEAGVPFDLAWARAFGEPVSPELMQEGLSRVLAALKEKLLAHYPGRSYESLKPDERRDAYLQAVDDMIDVTPDALMKFVKGPDFPTHGLILGVEGIKQAYTTGHGRVLMRARAQIEEPRAGRFQIVVTELPFQVNKANLVEKIADLVREKRIEGIAELRDESDRQGMRIVMELKREAKPKTLLNQLYKHTAMQQAFSVNTLALVDGQPRVLTLKMLLQQFVLFRRQVITRRTQFELDKALARLHILAGLKIALDHLDEVINTIRAAKDRPTAGKDLQAKFGLSDIQSQAILDMALGRLAALERQKIIDEYNEIEKLVKRLQDLLAHPLKILYVIRDETEEIAKKYAEPRRTRIIEQEVGDFSEEDLIPDEEVAVTVSGRGYIKRLPIDTYRVQRRGGRGITGMVTRDDDAVEHIMVASTHDSLLFFTDRGRVYQTRTHELPDASRQARGLPLINLINMDPKEHVTGFAVVKTFDPDRFFVMGTRQGEVKRVSVSDFASVRPSGLIAMDLDPRDELVWVRMTSGNDDVFIVTTGGQAIRFSEKEVRASNRGSGGVRGINLEGDDRVVALDVVGPKGGQLIVASKRGFGKRTDVAEFPRHARGGKGVRAQLVTDRTGPIAAARIINPNDELMMISEGGIVIRTEISTISQLGRAAQGVMLMRLGPGDSLVAFTRIEARDDGTFSATRRTTRRPSPNGNGAAADTVQMQLPGAGETSPNGKSNGTGTKPKRRPAADGAGDDDDGK